MPACGPRVLRSTARTTTPLSPRRCTALMARSSGRPADADAIVKALVQRGFGGDDLVAFEAVAEPVAAPGELVIEVQACALNRLDLLQRAAPVVRGFSLP